jgi:hemerythrin-like domain-containing protein
VLLVRLEGDVEMKVLEVLTRVERINKILDSCDMNNEIKREYFDDIIDFLEEYRDELLNKVVK